MGFIRDVLGRRLSARRRQSESEQHPSPRAPTGHALDTFPRLPSPRRPITPTPPDPQFPSSPFFRLPPELRQQIYRLLLSGREIHIDMRYTAAETTTPHSTRGASIDPDRRWRWRASTCHRHPDAQPLADRCGWGGPPPTACGLFDTPCGIGREALGLLLCCRLAYREAVAVLYAENTFHISTGALILLTDWLLPPARSAAVASLVYTLTEETAWLYAADHLGMVPGPPAYEALLSRIPAAFPSLRTLLVVVQGSLNWGRFWRARVGSHPPSRDRIKNCLLSSMDSAVAGFSKPLVEGVLAMGYPAFDRLMEEERANAVKVESREGKWLQFWRPLDVSHADEGIHTGYWVRRVAREEGAGSQPYFRDLTL